MNEFVKIRDLHTETTGYLDSVDKLTRSVTEIRDLLDFLILCIDYAEGNIPHQFIDKWSQSNPIFEELLSRLNDVYQKPPQTAIQNINIVKNTAGSAIADIYLLIPINYSHIVGERERDAFYTLSAKYNQIINGESEHLEVHSFLYRLNPLAASKFNEGSKQLLSIFANEDAGDPLISMRSALNLTIRTLIDLTGDTTIPKQVELIPRIAKYYAKDQAAQVDLVICNKNFLYLWQLFSKTKDTTFGRNQALGLALEVTSILNLFSKTIKLPRGM
jgi:hypothetical protein